MSIGLGIFLSTVLLITVWQVDKRGAWRKAGRVAVWGVLVLVLLLAGLAGYVYWENGRSERERRTQAKLVREGKLQGLWGLTFGMTPAQVLYMKGEPNNKSAREGAMPTQWHYYDASAPSKYSYTIVFDENDKVNAIACSSQETYYDGCDNIAGVGINDSETQVTDVLGTSLVHSTPDATGLKYLEYGNDASRARFSLKRQKVTSIIVDSYRKLTPQHTP
jgi:hypothetical protein